MKELLPDCIYYRILNENRTSVIVEYFNHWASAVLFTNSNKMGNTDFKKGDIIKYDNGKIQETFTVNHVSEHHLHSTVYNIPSYSKKYCKKVS